MYLAGNSYSNAVRVRQKLSLAQHESYLASRPYLHAKGCEEPIQAQKAT